MNAIVKKHLIIGNKFMPDMHLKQPEFTYSFSESFNKKKKE